MSPGIYQWCCCGGSFSPGIFMVCQDIFTYQFVAVRLDYKTGVYTFDPLYQPSDQTARVLQVAPMANGGCWVAFDEATLRTYYLPPGATYGGQYLSLARFAKIAGYQEDTTAPFVARSYGGYLYFKYPGRTEVIVARDWGTSQTGINAVVMDANGRAFVCWNDWITMSAYQTRGEGGEILCNADGSYDLNIWQEWSQAPPYKHGLQYDCDAKGSRFGSVRRVKSYPGLDRVYIAHGAGGRTWDGYWTSGKWDEFSNPPYPYFRYAVDKQGNSHVLWWLAGGYYSPMVMYYTSNLNGWADEYICTLSTSVTNGGADISVTQSGQVVLAFVPQNSYGIKVWMGRSQNWTEVFDTEAVYSDGELGVSLRMAAQ